MWNLVQAELAYNKRLVVIMAIATTLVALGALVYYGFLNRDAAPEQWNWGMLSNGLGTALIPYITLHWHMVHSDKQERRRRHWRQLPLTKSQIGWSRNLYLLTAGVFSALCTTLVLYAPLGAPFTQRLVLWFSLGGAALFLTFLIRLAYEWLQPKIDFFSIVVYGLIIESNFFLQINKNTELTLRFDQLSRQLYQPQVCLTIFALAALAAYLTQQLFVRRRKFN